MTDQRSAATGWIAPPADWEEVRARLAGLAEEYARFLAGRDPAAAEATGLPGEEPLPVTGPEALAEQADLERRQRRRVSRRYRYCGRPSRGSRPTTRLTTCRAGEAALGQRR